MSQGEAFDGVGPKVIPDLEQTFRADTGYTNPAVGDPVYISSDNGYTPAVSLCILGDRRRRADLLRRPGGQRASPDLRERLPAAGRLPAGHLGVRRQQDRL